MVKDRRGLGCTQSHTPSCVHSELGYGKSLRSPVGKELQLVPQNPASCLLSHAAVYVLRPLFLIRVPCESGAGGSLVSGC